MLKLKRYYESKQFYLLYFLFLFFVIGLVYIKYPITGKNVMGGDGTSLLLCRKWFYTLLSNGELPLWSSESAAGLPISSQMVGEFFPITFLFAPLPLQWYAWLNYVFFVAVGACFFAKFMEEMGIQRWLTACMGVMFLFAVCMGGARKSHIMIIECTALVPIAFYYCQRYINFQKKRSIVGAGIICGLMLLITTPAIQYVIYLLPILFVYVLFECILKKVSAKKLLLDAFVFMIVMIGVSAAQTIPGYELMTRYQEISGSSTYPMDFFQSYSIHPIKLLIMVFPNFFRDQYMSLGAYKSSGVDIELFVGVVATSIGLFGILRYWKDRRIRLFTCVAALTFIYAAHTNIPYLSEILYQIPFINTVRCPARALFMSVFLFYTIIGIIFSKLAEDAEGILYLKRFLYVLGAGFVIIIYLAYFTPIIQGVRQADAINFSWQNVLLRALIPILIEIVALSTFAVFLRKKRLALKQVMIVFVSLVTLGTVCETWKYATVDMSAAADMFTQTPEIISVMKKDIGNGKTITSYANMNSNESYTASLNAQLSTGIPSLNCYFTYNNPYLYQIMNSTIDSNVPYYNYGGLFRGYPNIYQLLIENDILSMLGVKYIEDRTGLFLDNVPYIERIASQNLDLVFNGEMMRIPACEGGYSIASQPITLTSKAYYRISMDIQTDVCPESFYIDLYGNGFDYPEYNFPFLVSKGQNTYSKVFYIGDEDIPKDLSIRVIAQNASDITITRIKLQRIEKGVDIYAPYRHDISDLFYENPLAKDIFYTVDFVKNIENQQELCLHPETYHYRDTCYLEGVVDQDLSNTNTKISNAKWVANNEIKVDVSSDKASFIAFSQCYDPNWRVYVDGKRVENHQTNLAIQGVFFEAGEHVIVYKYVPVIVYVSLAISTTTFLACIIYLILNSKKSRKNGSCNTDDEQGKSIRA